jgi:hypothetical protein
LSELLFCKQRTGKLLKDGFGGEELQEDVLKLSLIADYLLPKKKK